MDGHAALPSSPSVSLWRCNAQRKSGEDRDFARKTLPINMRQHAESCALLPSCASPNRRLRDNSPPRPVRRQHHTAQSATSHPKDRHGHPPGIVHFAIDAGPPASETHGVCQPTCGELRLRPLEPLNKFKGWWRYERETADN